MTRRGVIERYTEIDEMEAGVEMNLLVAEEVFGWQWWAWEDSPGGWRRDLYPPHTVEIHGADPADAPPMEEIPYQNSLHVVRDLPDYSGQAGAAMDVAAKLRESGWLVVIKWMPAEFYYIIQGSMSEYAPSPDEKGFKGKVIVDLSFMDRSDKELWRRYSLTNPPMSVSDELSLAVCRAGLKAAAAMVEMEREHADR